VLIKDKIHSVRAKYLAGCDGAKSLVRETLGIGLEGDSHLNTSCGIYFRTPRLWREHDKGKAIMSVLVDREGMWANLNATDGYMSWRLPVYREIEKDEAPACMRKAMGGEFDYEIRGINKWVRRAVVAERLSEGRCFLLGDAAHQLSPTGGFGMNTGMGDAVDLGWKLAATVQGWGGPKLLGSYDTERRPIGARAVREATVNYYKLKNLPAYPWIEDDGPEADAKRAELGRKFYESTRAEWESWGVQFGYRYADSPIVIPDGEPPPDDPMVYTPSSHPGCRAPHAWIGPGRSMLDLFGRDFVLMDSEQLGVKALYEKKFVLVRPDGHVAWRGDEAPAEEILRRVKGW
jgi:hypothetical protein